MHFSVPVSRGSNLAKIANLLGNRKKTCSVFIMNPGLKKTNHGYWDSGSRDGDYKVTFLNGIFSSCRAPQVTNPFAIPSEGNLPTVMVDNENCLVTTGTFCGKPAHMHIFCTQEFYDTALKE